METYIYSIQNNFPNHKVAPGQLQREIINSAISQVLDRICTQGDVCGICFESALSIAEKSILDAIIGAHQGVTIVESFCGSALLLPGSKVITATTDWETVGGLYTNPGFFVHSLDEVYGYAIGQVKSDAAGGQCRIYDPTRDLALSPVWAVPNTSGAWADMAFYSNVPPVAGRQPFEIQARKNSVPNLEVRYVTLTLMHVEVI